MVSESDARCIDYLTISASHFLCDQNDEDQRRCKTSCNGTAVHCYASDLDVTLMLILDTVYVYQRLKAFSSFFNDDTC